jgi:hypothetical protein
MRKSTAEDLSNALTEFQDRVATLASLLEERSPGERRRAAWGWLPGLLATVLSALALGLIVYFVAIVGPAPRVEAARSQPVKPVSLANARLFALYPDGRVEWNDSWSGRRLFQWDGHQWRTVEATPAPAAVPPIPVPARPIPPPAE